MTQVCPQAGVRGGGGVPRSDATWRLTCGFEVVELRGLVPLTPCLPCRFGRLLRPRSEADAHPTGAIEVTVTDRYIPLVAAAYGTRVARLERSTRLASSGNGSHSPRRRRRPPRPRALRRRGRGR